MLIESMAGKSGAALGKFHDATPFQYHEQNRIIDQIGNQLKASGYGYYGSEPLYNGLTGQQMEADIFIGVVFYQRLRHMVSDKYQVRSTGPVVALTRQPVKGRKKHGGIRMGEMERDSLLSHGVSYCVLDRFVIRKKSKLFYLFLRLMNCSDCHLASICRECGSLLMVHASVDSTLRING
jgi:DNA-directed RNA polymerase I subunit RPA2